MNEQQQDNYNILIDQIDTDYNDVNNDKLTSLEEYNESIFHVLQVIKDSGITALQWASNRIAAIEIDIAMSNVQFHAIETIIGKFKRFHEEANIRVYLNTRNERNPDHHDQELLNAREFFETRYKNALDTHQRIVNYFENALHHFDQAVLINGIDENAQISTIINSLPVPILNDDYPLQDINQSHHGVGYHQKLRKICENFQSFNENIYNIKNIATIIRLNENLPALSLILEEIKQEYVSLNLPID